ncbi:DUF892 family protein [Fulvivirgaceae bacterium BMA10]|uniref:DUF892 family protein n=1 Tax=Splendidivirga corallicola TaxID=3051826 RepID=A0ABT8KT44_9BACT|nr:DUF892 family protein [Fulvivirgaceae bacterium BMA10]
MENLKNLKDLFLEQIRDLYQGEKRQLDSLNYISEQTTNSKLKQLVNDHVSNTEDQIQRLERVFADLYEEYEGEKGKPMKALIKEARVLLSRCEDPEIRDAAAITALQHIDHYEIAGYGAACTYAKMLDMTEIADMLHQSLEEEKRSDRKLAMLAEESINQEAIHPH